MGSEEKVMLRETYMDNVHIITYKNMLHACIFMYRTHAHTHAYIYIYIHMCITTSAVWQVS